MGNQLEAEEIRAERATFAPRFRRVSWAFAGAVQPPPPQLSTSASGGSGRRRGGVRRGAYPVFQVMPQKGRADETRCLLAPMDKYNR